MCVRCHHRQQLRLDLPDVVSGLAEAVRSTEQFGPVLGDSLAMFEYKLRNHCVVGKLRETIRCLIEKLTPPQASQFGQFTGGPACLYVCPLHSIGGLVPPLPQFTTIHRARQGIVVRQLVLPITWQLSMMRSRPAMLSLRLERVNPSSHDFPTSLVHLDRVRVLGRTCCTSIGVLISSSNITRFLPQYSGAVMIRSPQGLYLEKSNSFRKN